MEFHKKRNQCLEDWIQKYGKIFGFFLGAKPHLICADVELLKIIQIKEAKKFITKDWVLPDAGVTHKMSENLMIFLKDEEWKSMNNFLSPSFSSGKIKMMSTLMSDPIRIFLEKIKKQNEEYFNIAKFCKRVIFDIICTSAFGIATNVQHNESNLFVQSAYSVIDTDSTDILAAISICFPEFEPIPTYLRRARDVIKWLFKLPSVQNIHDSCQKVINSRRESQYRPPDLLQTLINIQHNYLIGSKKLPDNFVIANALAFLVAGYETTGNTLCWCIHHLAHHFDIQEKIRQEIYNTVPHDLEIAYSDLINFHYLDQVILETLRFWPFSFLSVNRICKENFKYKDITISKGAIITVPISVLQSDPQYWHEPDKFNPDRFSPDNGSKLNPIVYQPFGAGMRMCIGKHLAKTILKLTLSNLIRSYRLEACDNTVEIKDIDLEYSLFMTRPKNGVNIKAVPLASYI